MYSNIPIQETIEIMEHLLYKNNIQSGITNNIINILKEITNQNYFQHMDKYYKYTDGLPMGSPLSGTLANIYLNHIENKYIINNQNIYNQHIKYWHRYVDDVIVLFTGTNRQLDLLHKYINNIHRNIKFTLEIEQEGAINFLDMTIMKHNHKHTFKIYRKPTQTEQTIHTTSNHPYQHKISAYRHMIERLNNIPMSSENYEDELNTIKYIAYRNGYNPQMIPKMNSIHHYKKNTQLYTTLNTNEAEKEKYISIEYNKNTSKHIKKIFQKYGYTTAYKTNQKLENKIKTIRRNELDSGIYRLTCADCNAYYIGQTGRTFDVRYKEHISGIGKQKTESKFAQHINASKHNYTNANIEILHRLEKGDNMNRLEELEIYRNRNDDRLLNNKINTNTNKIYDLIIHNSTHI